MVAQAVISEVWRTAWAKVIARDVVRDYSDIAFFKIGEGGSIGGLPATPDPVLRDLVGEGLPVTNGGTAAFSNVSAIVTGTGTTFLTDVSVGQWIKPGPAVTLQATIPESAGDPGTEHTIWGQVLSVDSDTQITLTANYGGSSSTGRVPRVADAAYHVFRKNLADADVEFFDDVPAITEVIAVVASAESNTDQFGNDPEFFELGLYDANGVQVCYITFDLEQKNVSIQLNHIIHVVV